MITGRILDLVILSSVLLAAPYTRVVESTPLKSRNLIYSEPGVIAVYIRPGNTPLNAINEELAEAFEFNAVKHGRLAFGREINEIINEQTKNPGAALAEGESYTLRKKPVGKNNATSQEEPLSRHIQKIPK